MPSGPHRVRAQPLLGRSTLAGTPGGARGCSVARGPGGSAVFVRWEQCCGEDAAWERLLREYRCLASVADLGVPRPLALRRGGGTAVLVTSFVDGARSLAEASADAESVARQLVRILRRAHAAGIVHGDVKPANLLLDPSGGLHLVDWELARAAGDTAAPGTLGWAPPCAWDEQYLANPWNDWYSAAVLLWELARGRRAFPGSRDAVIPAQRAFDFPGIDPDRTPAVAAVVESVRRRGTPDVTDPAALSGSFDAPRAAAHAAVRDAGLGSAALEETGSAGPRAVRVPAIAAPAVAEQAAAEDLASRGEGVAVAWSAIAARLEAEERAAGGGIQAARAAWVGAAAAALADVAGTGPATLVAAVPPDGRGDPGIERFLGFAARTDPGADLRVLLVSPRADPALDAAWVRSVVSQKLGAPEPPPEAVRDLCGAAALTGESIGRSIDAAVARGDVFVSAGSWRARPGALAGVSPVPSGPPAPEGDDPVAWIRHAERCILDGRAPDAWRACVRATTRALEAESLDPAEWGRLSDAWTEVGNLDAAGVALRAGRPALTSEAYYMRAGRLAAACKDATALTTTLSELGDLDASPDGIVCASRLAAVARLLAVEDEAARTALARCRRTRRSASLLVQAEYAMTLGNVLRIQGRSRLARRAYQFASRGAQAVGALKLGVQCELNRLGADPDRPAATAAEAWEAAAAFAAAWGFTTQSEYARAMAGAKWIACGEFARARRQAGPPPAVGRSLAWSDATRLAVAEACADREEVFAELVGPAPGGAFDSGLRRVLLRAELGGPEVVQAEILAAPGRHVVARGIRSVVRAFARSARAPARVAAVLSAAAGRSVDGSGLVEHAARAFESWGGPADDLLAEMRRRAAAKAGLRPLALALHALVLARRGAGGAAREWFRAEAAWDPERRPAGVREWEWLAALAACGVRGERGEIAGQLVGSAERYLDRAAPLAAPRRLAEVRARVVEVVTLSGHGLPPDVGPRVLAGLLERTRGAARGSEQEGGARAVLRCALRLRASSGVDDVLAEIVLGVLSVCPAERAVVIYDRAREGMRAKVGDLAGVRDLTPDDAEVSQSILARVRDADHAVVLDDVSSEALLGDRPSVRKFRPRSVMACPLRASGRYLGIMYVENRSRPGCFAGLDSDVLEAFAAQAALALENATLVEGLRASYAEVSAARKEAVRSESLRALGRMASEVAHDLNNLLTAIIGESQLLLTDPRFREAYQALRVIERAAQDGAECIRRIQDSTRQRDYAALAELDLVPVLEQVLTMTRVRCEAASGGSRVETVLEAPARALVRGAENELREVFRNLVVNAAESMADGGTVRVSVRQAGPDVVVTVADTGCGIPPEVLPRLFEPFFSTKGEKGNGLGLSIAQGIVRRHGGEIRIESEVGKGTTVRVSLPRVVGDVGLPAPETAGASDAGGSAVRPRASFLIVDDDPSVIRVLGQMLRQSGVEVDQAVGGQAAIAKIASAKRPYTCVVTDIHMPTCSGLDVASAVRRRHPLTKVVLMSGCGTTLETAYGGDRGISEILRKPFTLEAVRRLARG